MSEQDPRPLASSRRDRLPVEAPDAVPPEGMNSSARLPGRSLPVGRRRLAVGAVVLLFLSGLLFWQFDDVRDSVHALCFEVQSSGKLTHAANPPAPRTQVPAAGARNPLRGLFDLSNLTVPAEEIRSGGPPKDGIPALTNPTLIAAKDATYLRPEDRVIGFVAGDETRAYPLKILNYHEIVNDRVGELPIAITYCPLCDSVAAFDRRTPLGERNFGVSGLLYNSNVLLYDRDGRRDSLWSQLRAEGISGPAAARSLTPLPLELTTWQDWRQRYPQTKVLSGRTGHRRDYDQNPYAGYFAGADLMFPVRPTSDRLPAKARVLGVWTEGAARAYPESAFAGEPAQIEDRLEGKRVVVEYRPDARSLRIVEADDGVHWMYAFWFGWYAFHPETTLHGHE